MNADRERVQRHARMFYWVVNGWGFITLTKRRLVAAGALPSGGYHGPVACV